MAKYPLLNTYSKLDEYNKWGDGYIYLDFIFYSETVFFESFDRMNEELVKNTKTWLQPYST